MAKTGFINARVEPTLKQEVEQIFTALGVTTTEALTLFYKQVVLQRGLPFDVRLPNERTRAALNELNEPEKLNHYTDVNDMMRSIRKINV